MQEKNGISQILNLLSPHIKEIVSAIPEEFADRMWEICLRTNQPIIVRCYSEFYFLTENGIVTKIYRDNLPKVKKKEIDETFFKMCEYSVHAKSNEIREGYLTLPGGHRVGVCGTAVAENGRVLTLKYISSLNIRISREAAGCASKIVNEFYSLKKRPGAF